MIDLCDARIITDGTRGGHRPRESLTAEEITSAAAEANPAWRAVNRSARGGASELLQDEDIDYND